MTQEIYNGEFEARREALIAFTEAHPSMGLSAAAAQFAAKKDVSKAIKLFEEMLEHPFGDMFFVYALMGTYLYNRDKLPDGVKAKVRETWRTYTPYRGDTENHWLLYYTALYLAAQTWPHEDGSTWFNGKSSQENFEEAEGWIDRWVEITTTIGQGEFDSPTYHAVFLAPMLLLYDFASDPTMRKKAEMMLDYLFADFAVEYLQGIYCGAHSRDYPINVVEPKTSPMSIWGYLYFGQTEFPGKSRDFGMPLMATFSTYRLPQIIYSIATDRNNSYIHTETKRVRNIVRLGPERNPPVYKYTYMTKEYCLGSMQGGILQPIQEHTWDVTYISSSPYNRIFTVHPYTSGRELGMFFPEEMKLMVETVSKAHTYYGDENKWSSSSPFEQTFQHKSAIIVLCNIESGTTWEHIDGFFPKDLEDRIEDPSGWIFCLGGNAYIAYYPLRPYRWIEEDICYRLRSPDLKNGCVVEVASADEYSAVGGFEGFCRRIRSNRLDVRNFNETLAVSYTTSAGDKMMFTYDGERLLNGKAVNFKDYKLFNGPFLKGEVGIRKLTITYRDQVRVLDFDKAAILEPKNQK